MKFVQWNLTSFNAQYNFLKLIINSNQPTIIALQETRFKKENAINIPHYNIYFKNRPEAAGGVAIYVKETYRAEQINLQTSLEAIAIKFYCDQIITLCNLFIPPDHVVNQSEI